MRRNCDVGDCEQQATHFRDQWHHTGATMGRGSAVLIRMYACEAHAQYDQDLGYWVPIFWAREVGK